MTSDDPPSPLKQQALEIDRQQPHIRTPILNEIDELVGEPQFPKTTLTLDPQITVDPPEEDSRAVKDVIDEQPIEAEEESEPQLGMPSPSPSRGLTAAKATPFRRGCKRKRMNRKHVEVLNHKVQILTANLKLIPFVPNRALDIASHESLLRRIGLWDFVHVELDNSDLRVDLIAQLVVNYKRQGRLSEVNGVRIKVSRADLGRALKLPPVKKDNSSVITVTDEDAEFVTEKSVHFIEELMSNWMLLHDDEAWILPEEVMNWIEMIRKGHPDKVEWASLMWFMVEREISQGVSLTECYYASHLQHLIKHQNPRLFLVEPGEEVTLKEEEEEYGGDVNMVDESQEVVAPADSEDLIDEKITAAVSEKCEAEKTITCVGEACSEEKNTEEFLCVEASSIDNYGQMKEPSSHIETGKSSDSMDLLNDCPEVKAGEPSVELTLGQDNNEKDSAQPDDVMDFDDLGLGDSNQWQLNEKSAEEEPFLRQCSFGEEKDSFNIEGKEEEEEDAIEEKEVNGDDNDDDDDGVEVEEEEEVEVEEDVVLEEEDDNDDEAEESDLPAKFDSLEGISDDHMFQGLDISQGAFGSPLSLINESSMQHFTSHTGPSSSTYGNTLKRVADHEQNLSYHTDADGHKRLRCDGTWDHQETSDFYRCMESIEHWMGKAKMTYAAKEQECTQMGMNQQLLYAELEQRNHLIEHHEKIANEVRQKSQLEIYKLERELFIMGGLLDSYRKGLKETRREFSDYRERCSVPEEPLYKDAGPGGVVLSVAELERQRLKREEEDKMKRVELEITIKRFEAECYPVFEGHHNDVQKLDEKLLLLEEKVKLLKGLPQNQKGQEITEQPAMTED